MIFKARQQGTVLGSARKCCEKTQGSISQELGRDPATNDFSQGGVKLRGARTMPSEKRFTKKWKYQKIISHQCWTGEGRANMG